LRLKAHNPSPDFQVERGIMAYLKNGGTLEKAAATANHASPFCDRRRDEVNLDQVERIVI
jgi:hypothetical protein